MSLVGSLIDRYPRVAVDGSLDFDSRTVVNTVIGTGWSFTGSPTISGAHTLSGAVTFSAAGVALTVTNDAQVNGRFGLNTAPDTEEIILLGSKTMPGTSDQGSYILSKSTLTTVAGAGQNTYWIVLNSTIATAAAANTYTRIAAVYLNNAITLGAGSAVTNTAQLIAATIPTAGTNNAAIAARRGTVTAGAYCFFDGVDIDADSGLFSSGANDVTAMANGVAKVRWNATGIGFYTTVPVAQAAAIAAVPAGGTGTAAGGWDTAANRDDAITKINNLLTAIRNLGLIAP